MHTISILELQSALAANPHLLLLDVRTPAEFHSVHIPAARSLPLDMLNPQALASLGEFTREQPLYVVCQSGSRAQLAAKKLGEFGFLNSIVVEGGTDAWLRSDLPVVRGASKIISLERQVRIAAGSLVLIGLALGVWGHPGLLGLSACVGAGLVFAGITDFCGLALLLAKLPWNKRASS